ncbi:hypothetical protein ACP4OV_013344 [Aristida adscensionis]
MGDQAAPPAWMAAAARRWLEDAGAMVDNGGGADHRAFNALPLSGVRVALAERGRALCSLRVPAHLTDAEGNWHAGAIAAAADDVCAAAILSVEGIIKVSVHYDISYFSPAKLHRGTVAMRGGAGLGGGGTRVDGGGAWCDSGGAGLGGGGTRVARGGALCNGGGAGLGGGGAGCDGGGAGLTGGEVGRARDSRAGVRHGEAGRSGGEVGLDRGEAERGGGPKRGGGGGGDGARATDADGCAERNARRRRSRAKFVAVETRDPNLNSR